MLVLSEAVLVLVIDDRRNPGKPFDYEYEHHRKRLSTSTMVATPWTDVYS